MFELKEKGNFPLKMLFHSRKLLDMSHDRYVISSIPYSYTYKLNFYI